MTVSAAEVAAARAFNRFYTTLIGVLGEGLLRTPYSLTEARVLFELAQREEAEVVLLRRALDLDPGYLSRMLARFEADGLIVRARSADDARRQVARLTAAGREVFERLDRLSAEDVGALLGRVPQARRPQLIAAMRTIQELLADPPRRPSRQVDLRPPRAGDFGWVVQRNGAVYAAEYGWDSTYEALVARIVAGYIEQHDPARESAWLADLDGEPVGCVFCVRKDDAVAQLRLLLVDPRARGMGIGERLVAECLRFAAGAGYGEIMLWTNDCLTAARRIYERAGFELERQEPHHSFGQDLTGQFWRRRLQPIP